jgi:hypothetical protein
LEKTDMSKEIALKKPDPRIFASHTTAPTMVCFEIRRPEPVSFYDSIGVHTVYSRDAMTKMILSIFELFYFSAAMVFLYFSFGPTLGPERFQDCLTAGRCGGVPHGRRPAHGGRHLCGHLRDGSVFPIGVRKL